MCGIVGIHGSAQATFEVYQGLLLLQHRGQDAAGILSFDPKSHNLQLHKDHGLVAQVFDEKKLTALSGNSAIAHTRYATVANKTQPQVRDIQPMLVNYPHGLGLVHNGNIVNVEELTQLLKEKFHRLMLTKNDAEILLNMLSTELQSSMKLDPLAQIELAATEILNQATGGYALIALWANGYMFGLRDPHGIRPLILGKKINSETGKTAYIFSSESHVLNFLGYEMVRDVEAGEIIMIDPDGNLHSTQITQNREHKPCMFEWVYFATPETVMDGRSVYQARLDLGINLGAKIQHLIQNGKISPDVIVPVPESGRIAAIALSEKIHVPYRELLIKNRYIQRSFILQDQLSRNKAVNLKLLTVQSEIKGKNILVVDDSIVRGTTSKRIVETLKHAGAKAVYFVSTCPPIKNPCYFGIDFPLKDELIAASLNEEELAHYLGADAVIYQDIEGLKKALKKQNICQGCLLGDYPVDVSVSAVHFEAARKKSNAELV